MPYKYETEDWRRNQRIKSTYGISDREYRAWLSHGHSAKRRDIPFRFTLLAWWCWWRAEFAKLPPGAARGLKRGQFVMARIGDAGAYERGNVKCITALENVIEADPEKRSKSLKASHAARKAAGIVHHLAVRGDGHPSSKPVLTPLGRFGSAALAAEAHGITRQAAARKATRAAKGWRYAL